MNPIQKLMAEHQIILQVITLMESKIQALERGEKVGSKFFEFAIDFIRNYADKYHHAKEEDILFVRMGKAGFSKESGPIAVMLYEHDEGRQYIVELEKANTLYAQGNETAKYEIITNASAYAALLRNHIQKEDNILYPMAINLLGESVINLMQAEFDEAEMRQAGVESKYQKLIDSMGSTEF